MSARKIAVRTALSACECSTSASPVRVRTKSTANVTKPPAACRYPVRASAIPRRMDATGPLPSATTAGTQSPTSASQRTLAIANHGKRSAAGTKTRVPTSSATSQDRAGARTPRASVVAYANASVKKGAARSRTSVTAARLLPTVSWFATATTSPSGSARTKRAP